MAVAKWVREWISGKFTSSKLPYHLERYLANRSTIPTTHWSMLNELTLNLIAPLEQSGYHLPDHMVPDISEGRIFSKWLRDNGHDPSKFPTYEHMYADGRKVPARLYPNSLLAEFRKHFHEVWIPEKMRVYFSDRDSKSLPYIDKFLLELQNIPTVIELQGIP